MSDQYDRLEPPVFVPTMASLPRRLREALGPVASAVDEVAGVATPHARSIRAILDELNGAVPLLSDHLRRVSVMSDDRVPRAAVDRAARQFPSSGGRVADQLSAFAPHADAFIAEVKRVSTGDWHRRAQVEGGGYTTVLDLAREALRTALESLHELERAAKDLAPLARHGHDATAADDEVDEGEGDEGDR